MAVIQTKALLLRHATDREHDRYIVALSPQYGQLRLRARGTKKSVSKLGGSLEPLMEVDLTLANGKVIDQVIGSVIIRRFGLLRDEAVSIVAAQWLLELVEHISKPNQESSALYTMAINALDDISQHRALPLGQRWLRLMRTAWMVLAIEGFVPSTELCSHCHELLRPKEQIQFDVQHGFVHAHHQPKRGRSVSGNTLEFLRGGQTENEREVFTELRPIFETVLHHALDRPLRSDTVLRSVMRLAKLSTE